MVLREVSKFFGDRPIFQRANASIQDGDHIGFVGPNGIGKTTLLRIAAGLEPYDSGEVIVPSQYEIGFLEQEVPEEEVTLQAYLERAFGRLLQMGADMKAAEASLSQEDVYSDEQKLSQAMAAYARLQQEFELAGGYEYLVKLRTVMYGLGFCEQDAGRPLNSFSGGERMRAQLGRLLLQEPDLLLLDEPTNHLDVEAAEWLEQYLAGYRRAFVVVSHDRYFLDQVAQRIWELDGPNFFQYKGNYSKFAPQRELRLAQQQESREQQEAEMKRIEQFIRKYGAGTKARQAKSLQKRLAKMGPLAEKTARPGTMRFVFQPRKTSGEKVAFLEGISFAYPEAEEAVLSDVSTEIVRGDRIGLVGPNGSGKTTLLRILAGELAPRGRLAWGTNVEKGYSAQTFHFTPGLTVLEELYHHFDLTLGELRSVLARFLFRGEDVFKLTDVLSGGEKNRLSLAHLLLTAPNVLLLDEPTNHLDIHARAALEAALLDFGGTIVFVSHDRYFVDRLATRLWVLEGGTIRDYAGTYSRYRQEVRQQELEQKRSLERTRRSQEQPAAPTRRERQRQESLEDFINDLEAEKARLEKELASPTLYKEEERSRQTVSRYRDIQERLEELYGEWEALWQ